MQPVAQISHRVLFLVLLSVFGINGVRHELRLYSEPDQQGTEVVITAKIPNINMPGNGNISFILGSVESYCLIGSWSFYFKPNYVALMGSVGHLTEQLCVNDSGLFSKDGGLQSFRYHGPSDSSTKGLSLSGSTTQGLKWKGFGGEEIVLNESQPMNNVPFVPKFLLFTGYSIWTGFANADFSGKATCYIPMKEFAVFEVGRGERGVVGPPKSVTSGCDPTKIDSLEFVTSDYDIDFQA